MPLNTLVKIENAVKERPAQLKAAKQKGKKVVGWFSYNVPVEIFHALGLIPVRLGLGGSEALVEKGGRYLSTQNCVFLREAVGLFEENTDPYIKSADLVVFDTTCLQTFRTAQVVKYYFNVNTLLIDVPKNFHLPEGVEYYRKEVADFAAKLEEFAGTKLDARKLAESVELHNNIRSAVKKLYSYQAASNPAISWREVYNVVQAGYYLCRSKYLTLLQELLGQRVRRESLGHARPCHIAISRFDLVARRYDHHIVESDIVAPQRRRSRFLRHAIDRLVGVDDPRPRAVREGRLGLGLGGGREAARGTGAEHDVLAHAAGHRFYFQFTITGYPRELESHAPPLDVAIRQFRRLADRIGPEAVIWRYDPIVISSPTR